MTIKSEEGKREGVMYPACVTSELNVEKCLSSLPTRLGSSTKYLQGQCQTLLRLWLRFLNDNGLRDKHQQLP
eukprot:6180657-Pleurochrysis_carterae.AAC.2